MEDEIDAHSKNVKISCLLLKLGWPSVLADICYILAVSQKYEV